MSLASSQNARELPPGPALFSVFICMLFGANAVAVKVSLAGIGPFTVAGLRFLLAALTISLWAALTGQPLKVTRQQGWQLGILAILFTVQIALFYQGLRLTTASHGTLIGNLQPFVVLLLAHFYLGGERITARRVAGITLGFAGVLCVVFDHSELGPAGLRGDLLTFFAVLVWGSSAVYMKRLSVTIHPLILSLHPMFLAIPCFLLAGFFFDEPMISHLDGPVLLALAYQSFVTASFGFIAWNNLIRTYGATALHSFIFVMPVSGVLCGVLLLGEPLNPAIGLAIVLIAAGIIVINRRGQ